jgi:tetratricopeptide (TPR) repeat protein
MQKHIPRRLQSGGGPVAQIFLSYSRKDSEAAEVLAKALSNVGHNVWWDTQISGGSKFAAEIEQALTDAEIILVLWSRNSIGSAWVLDEAAEGRDTNRLIPVALGACKPPLGFRQFQTIAVPDRAEAAVDEILTAVARKSGRQEIRSSVEQTQSRASETASPRAAARRLAEQGKFDEAWSEIQAALEIDPRCAETNREAAKLLYAQGRPADAIPLYEEAAGSSKGDHESPAALISCYRAIQDDAALKRAAAFAIARAEQSIAAAINTGAAFASGAKGLAALGHGARARKWIRKALAVEPGNLVMRYDLAATLACFLDDRDAAIDVLEPFAEAASNQFHLQLLERDVDWEGIRECGAFQTLLSRARKRVEALQSV